mgnify:CR=1 FL=1
MFNDWVYQLFIGYQGNLGISWAKSSYIFDNRNAWISGGYSSFWDADLRAVVENKQSYLFLRIGIDKEEVIVYTHIHKSKHF